MGSNRSTVRAKLREKRRRREEARLARKASANQVQPIRHSKKPKPAQPAKAPATP